MKPFSFVGAHSLDEVKEALHEYGDEARVIAGGQSLLNMMKMRIIRPAYLVSIGNVNDLKQYCYTSDGKLEIGATVAYATLAKAKFQHGPHQMISEVSGNIADIAVRNIATAGGAICQADPHSDFPTLAVALNSEFDLESKNGKRTVAAADFFTDYYETALQPDEILTKMRFPVMDPRVGWAFEKFYFRQGDYALVSVACTLTAKPNGEVENVKIIIGSTEPLPVRAEKAEQFLAGRKINEKTVEEAGRLAMSDTDPLEDSMFSSSIYKKELVKTMTKRALLRANSRVKG